MRITVTNTATQLNDLLANGEVADILDVKRKGKKFSVFLQNNSEADVFFDSSDIATVADGCIIGAGGQVSIDLYSLTDITLIAEADAEVRVMVI